jgi:hypothetical protein
MATVDLILPLSTNDELRQTIALLHPHLNMETGPWLAGGSIHRLFAGMDEKFNYDIDIFCADHQQVKQMQYVGQSLKAKHKIQVITDRYFQSAQQLIDDFDFTIVQFASDGRRVLCAENSLNDIEHKRLRLNEKSEIRAAYRLSKYCGLGYIPDSETVDNSLKATGVYYIVEAMTVGQDLELNFEMTEMMRVKSALSDLLVGDINGQPYVFFKGHPMPFRIAFPIVALYHEVDSHLGLSTQRDVVWSYLRAWKKMGLPSWSDVYAFATDALKDTSKEQLAKAYSWMASTTYPSPSSSSSTDTRLATTSALI